jgi:hypothetical protein
MKRAVTGPRRLKGFRMPDLGNGKRLVAPAAIEKGRVHLEARHERYRFNSA